MARIPALEPPFTPDVEAQLLAGHLPLPLGVLGHEGSTVIVGLNGRRLLRDAAWNRVTASQALRL